MTGTQTHERGTQQRPLLFAEGERPPLSPDNYDHVHIGDRCRRNRFPVCGYRPQSAGEGRETSPGPSPAVCTACQLALMLERGVLSASVDAGHSSCEGDIDHPCACTCDYARYRQCRECGRKGTSLTEDGRCTDSRDCANAILEAVAARTAERKARQAVAPPAKTRSSTPAGTRDCKCGCGEKTGGGLYRPGHDARHVSALVSLVRADGMALAEAEVALEHSDKLIAKLRKAVGA